MAHPTTQAPPLNDAGRKLRDLQKLHPIRFFQAGDNDELCGTCMVPIVRGTDGWRHSPDAIRQLREQASAGQWPRP